MALSNREKRLSTAFAVFIACWGIYLFGIRPLNANIQTLKRVVPDKQAILSKMLTASNEYKQYQDSIDQIDTRIASGSKDFLLIKYAEKMLKNNNIKGNISSPDTFMQGKYTRSNIQISIDSIEPSKIAELLKPVKALREPVFLSDIQIERKSDGLVSCSFTICSISLQSK